MRSDKNDFQTFFLRFASNKIRKIIKNFIKIEFNRLENDFVGLSFGKIQNIVDDFNQIVGCYLNFSQVTFLSLIEFCLLTQVHQAIYGDFCVSEEIQPLIGSEAD